MEVLKVGKTKRCRQGHCKNCTTYNIVEFETVMLFARDAL